MSNVFADAHGLVVPTSLRLIGETPASFPRAHVQPFAEKYFTSVSGV